MAEAMLIGAGVGAGTALLSGNDWKTGAMMGGATGGIGSQLTSNPLTAEALKAGAGSAVSNGASHLAQTGVEQATANAVASSALDPTLAGLQQEILSEVPQSAVNNSVMQPQDFIGSHLTSNVDNQGLMNNFTGTYTDGIADPLQAYPSFDKPVASTAEELAMADGGYGGSIFDGFGDTLGKFNDFTGMEAKDWTKMGITQGADLLQPDPQKPIQHAPMGSGISRPQVDLSQSAGSLLSSNPMTSGAGGQQLTAEQIKLLQQRGLI
jgi:hypothetical protein